MTHHHAVRVYYEDTDAGGVVYHARFLAFAERARTEALRHIGAPHAELMRDHGLAFVVRRAEMDYLRPSRLDDVLDVVTGPWVPGGARVTVAQRIERSGQPLVTLRIMLAAVGADGRPARIPARWLASLRGVHG